MLAKFTPGALVAFLLKPSEHFAWIGMPDFKLSNEEAFQLAAYLESAADKPSERTIASDEALILKGRIWSRAVAALTVTLWISPTPLKLRLGRAHARRLDRGLSGLLARS